MNLRKQALKHARGVHKLASESTETTLGHLDLAIVCALDADYRAALHECRAKVLAYRDKIAEDLTVAEAANAEAS